MRNDRRADRDEDTDQLQLLQQQIDDLAIRTARLEGNYTERAVPIPSRRATGNRQYNPTVGDYVRFRSTKITRGGSGQIVRIVRNFVIIQHDSGELVQQAPRNVALVTPATTTDNEE